MSKRAGVEIGETGNLEKVVGGRTEKDTGKERKRAVDSGGEGEGGDLEGGVEGGDDEVRGDARQTLHTRTHAHTHKNTHTHAHAHTSDAHREGIKRARARRIWEEEPQQRYCSIVAIAGALLQQQCTSAAAIA